MAQTILKAADFEPLHTDVKETKLDGEPVLRVVKTEKTDQFDEDTCARLRGVSFHNGTIEVKMLSRLLPDAPDFARGFIGIVFRADEKLPEFESFYVRPTNGTTNDPVRKKHGCQYFSYPGYTFAYFRDHRIDTYESSVPDIALDQWIALKAIIRDDTAEFYVNGTHRLTVNGLKHGSAARGAVGFYVDTGTEAFYKDFVITSED